MALSKAEKKALVEEYKQRLSDTDALFVMQPKGINPNEASELKKKLYDSNASFNVVKNSLFRIALKESNIELEVDEGENAVVFTEGDFSAVAKMLSDFISDTEKAEFRAGVIQQAVITKDQFIALSNLPSREVLLAQVLSGMQAPITGFVRVLNGNLSGLVNVINAIKDQKSE